MITQDIDRIRRERIKERKRKKEREVPLSICVPPVQSAGTSRWFFLYICVLTGVQIDDKNRKRKRRRNVTCSQKN